MAFRQPQRLQPARQPSFTPAAEDALSPTSQQLKRPLGDPQEEWVLFSPAPLSTKTATTSTERTPRTVGLSRFSEVGSLDTAAAQSDQPPEDVADNLATHDDEDADLDSLDEGLLAFHEPSDHGSPRARMIRSNETVLPTHDGLGAFAASSTIQDHLKQFERFGPKKKQKRRSSVQRTLDALREVDEADDEVERIRRIEKWRLEQSRALLEEVERETERMRRLSRATSARSVAASNNMQTKSETDLSVSAMHASQVMEQSMPELPEDGPPENESWWQRLTRRVIRDLIGIDEELLSVILGEALPEEAQTTPSSSSASVAEPRPADPLDSVEDAPWHAVSWQERLLERLARELGILVHQLSVHPGAFTAYLRTQETPAYVGLTHSAPLPAAEHVPEQPSIYARAVAPPFSSVSVPTSPLASARSSVLFQPTLQQQQGLADPSLWGIEEEDADVDMIGGPPGMLAAELGRLRREQEYWERELDVRMVFNFLKSRFSRDDDRDDNNGPSAAAFAAANAAAAADLEHTYAPPYGFAPQHQHVQQQQPPADLRRAAHRRAALIRQHHPLAGRRRAASLRAKSVVAPTAVVVVAPRGSGSESCASQSSKLSKRSGGAGSRNYWDVGGSTVGSSTGWGEVSI
jgi:hypothetical protein